MVGPFQRLRGVYGAVKGTRDTSTMYLRTALASVMKSLDQGHSEVCRRRGTAGHLDTCLSLQHATQKALAKSVQSKIAFGQNAKVGSFPGVMCFDISGGFCQQVVFKGGVTWGMHDESYS